MGMDIYSQQGIVFTVSELLPKIFKFKKQQLESLISALCCAKGRDMSDDQIHLEKHKGGQR